MQSICSEVATYKVYNMKDAQFGNFMTSVGNDNIVEKSQKFYGDYIKDGQPVNLRNLSQIHRKVFSEAIEKGEKLTDMQYIPLSAPILDDLIAKKFTGKPVIADAWNDPMSVIESEEQANAALAKAIGATSLHIISPNDAMSPLAKTITAQSPFIHAVADYDVGLLFKRPYPFQAMIPTEAVRGREVKWDVIRTYGLAGAEFGTEDPTLIESDFPQNTRNDHIRFRYSTGRITDAAYRTGLAAYPARDFMTLATDNHMDAMRSLLERALLGITLQTNSINNTYTTIGNNGLAFPGMHEMITNNTTSIDDGGYKCWESGASISNSDWFVQYQNLDAALNQSAINMNVLGVQPNLMICDPKTFAIMRAGLMKTQYGVPPTTDYSFGISSIRYSLQGEPEMSIIQHPFLPRTSGQSAIYLVDTRLLARRVAWDNTFEVLAKLNPSQKFYMSSADCFIDKSDINGTSSLMGGVIGITHQKV